MAETKPYDNIKHYYMYDIGWLIDAVLKVSQELNQAIDLRTIHYADPINWDITTQYQANTVVVNNKDGVAYISSKNVPAGVLLTNTEYWTPIFNYNDAINKLMSTIAYNERDNIAASRSYKRGQYLYSNGQLYAAIKEISAADALREGANIDPVIFADSVIANYDAVAERLTLHGTSSAESIMGGDIDVSLININNTDINIKDATAQKAVTDEAAARKAADAAYVGNNQTSTVTGDYTVSAGDIAETADNVTIHGKLSVLIDSNGKYTEDITGDRKIDAANNEETYTGTHLEHVSGEVTKAYDNNVTVNIDGTYSRIVKGQIAETHNASRTVNGTNDAESMTGIKSISAKDIRLTPTNSDGAVTYSKPTSDGKLVTVPYKDTDGNVYRVLCEGTAIDTKTAKRQIILISDSYGDTAIQPNTWIVQLANMLSGYTVYSGWQGGAGFVTTTGTTFDKVMTPGAYTHSIPYIADKESITDIVIVGGFNDRTIDADVIQTAAAAFLTKYSAQYPNAVFHLAAAGWSMNISHRQELESKKYFWTYDNLPGYSHIPGAWRYIHAFKCFVAENGSYVHPNADGSALLANLVYSHLFGGSSVPHFDYASGAITLDGDFTSTSTPSVAMELIDNYIRLNSVSFNYTWTAGSGGSWLKLCTLPNIYIVNGDTSVQQVIGTGTAKQGDSWDVGVDFGIQGNSLYMRFRNPDLSRGVGFLYSMSILIPITLG